MNFQGALNALKNGSKVSRSGWNGKGMWLLYTDNGSFSPDPGDTTRCTLLPFIVMSTAQGEFVPWLCSQTDMLADDWGVVA